ncbi:hypothetical protein [Aquisphaera insulae]|uniref:hypothetical protein n=1 Tax=Aquisphaera insulae TaxID=2712864 RepID=UPI0013EE0CE6|nr:hypothetical protein [Aquisphaera insulae]
MIGDVRRIRGRRLGITVSLVGLLFGQAGCAGIRETSFRWPSRERPAELPAASPQAGPAASQPSATAQDRLPRVALPDVEQMIDELDRMMTSNGTIGVKSPDVWGQDRLSKFRFEYETQMSEWVKSSFKGDMNAQLRRGESEARRLSVAGAFQPGTKTAAGGSTTQTAAATATTASISAEAPTMPNLSGDKLPVSLEPTVVLDEHSNYLNHLNQLRRINAGDDLTDRPGYGLYLVRIPVTLSPGPKSRRGRGAIITVSAKSLMTRETMRNTLRNAVINETVNNLSQAIASKADPEKGASFSSAGSFSLLAYADTEVYYGSRNIALLLQEAEHLLARDFADEPHHRDARIAEWLRSELESSYHLFEESAGPARSGQRMAAVDPLEELGELLVHRDYPKVAAFQSRVMRDGMVRLANGDGGVANPEDAPTLRKPVTEFLGFALRIQAAAVNRRLKKDMLEQDPNLMKQVNLKDTSFFDPQAPQEVIRLFEKYVDAKWPLRVYAIEPVIAQQNVADAFGRRSQSSFELAGAGPVGPLRALGGVASAGFASDKKVAEDETAIRLNPTMVGFGAGENTFGWVFYPRIQTMARGRGLFTSIALLARGDFPDGSGKEQSIEPGQRECTALIVMPNFVPKLEFVTVANWFKTSETSDGQKSDLEKSSTLARRLVVAENALQRAKVEGQYRPEEFQIAMERINQLKSLMPTQRLVVNVPFTGDLNDSRIFCSEGGQLRPMLVAWHGRPPEQGEESTILIEGKNFSVHDTHIIAGGKPAKSILVSRNVLEVTITPEACPIRSDENRELLLDITAATPNGVSNHLLLPMQPARADRKKPGSDAPAEKVAKDDGKAAEKLTKDDGKGGSPPAIPPLIPAKSVDPIVKPSAAEDTGEPKKK